MICVAFWVAFTVLCLLDTVVFDLALMGVSLGGIAVLVILTGLATGALTVLYAESRHRGS